MGLQAVFKSVFPIADYNGNATLEFHSYHFGDPKYTVEECHDRGMTFAIPLKVTLRLKVVDNDKETKTQTVREVREQEVYLGELPLMTEKGTFIINGTERVVVVPAPALGRRVLRRRQGQDASPPASCCSPRASFPTADRGSSSSSTPTTSCTSGWTGGARCWRRRSCARSGSSRRASILSDEEILGLFYETEEVLAFEDRLAWVKLSPEVHNGVQVADDVKAPKRRGGARPGGQGAQSAG